MVWRTNRSSEREPAVSLGEKYERHRRLAPVADLCAMQRKMKATWDDVQRAYESDSIESLDKITLEAFARVQPPSGMSPFYVPKWEQMQKRIANALERFEAEERERKNEERHAQALRVATGANHIAKWAIVIAVLALIVAVVQTFWH